MADDTTLQLGGDPSGAVSAIREVASELRAMTEKNGASVAALGKQFEDAVGKKLPAATEKGAKGVGLLDDQWRKMTSSFTAANLIDRALTTVTSSLGDMIAHARQTASTMTDLSDRTGHSVEFLQQAGYAARVAGFDFNTFANGAFTLGVKLAGGSGSVRQAVADLGLGWQDLLSMSIDDRMRAVTRALAEQTDPAERNRIAVTLFGGAAKVATDAAAAGWEKYGAAAVVASREQLEAIKRGETAWKQFTGFLLGTGLKVFGDLASEISEAAASVDSLSDAQAREFIAQQRLGRGHQFLIEVQRERTRVQKDHELTTVDAVSATEKYAAATAQAQKELANLDAPTRQAIKRAKELGASEEDLANDFGVTQGALKLLEQQTKTQEETDKAATEAAKQHADDRKKFADALFGRDVITKAQQYVSALGGVANISKLSTEKQKELNTAVTAAIEVYRKAGQTAPASWQEIADASTVAGTVQRTYNVTLGEYVTQAGLAERATEAVWAQFFALAGEVERIEPPLKAVTFGWSTYKASVESALPGLIKAGAEWERQQRILQGRQIASGLRELSSAMADLAESTGRTDGSVARVGELIGLMSVGATAGSQFAEAVASMDDGGASVQNVMQLATSFIALAAAMHQSTDKATAFERQMSGMSTGAAAGSSFGAWGALIGGIAGLIYGAFRDAPDFAKVMQDVGRRWGVQISQGVAEGIAEDARTLFGGDREVAALFNLDAILDGVETSRRLPVLQDALQQVFDFLAQGRLTEEQARTILDQNFGALAASIQATGQIASDEFLRILDLNAQMGTQSAEIAAFVQRQTSTIGSGLAGQLRPLTAEYDGLGPKITKAREAVAALAAEGRAGSDAHAKAVAELNALLAQQQSGASAAGDDVARIGRLAVASFNAAIAKGMDWNTAIQNIGPALDQITALNRDLGIASNDAAVQELLRFRQLSQEHQALFEAAGALNEVMVAMSSIGALNAETLADLEAQGLQTFESLVAAGLTEQQALAQMKGWINNVHQAHQQLGIPIDENTQRLIDQARAQGILEEKGTSTNDILIQGIGALIEVLGGTLPEAWRKSADSASTESQRMKSAAGGVSGAVDGVSSRVDGIDWRGMADEAIDALRDVQGEVDAVSFGHSPGGLKEYPILLRQASRAMDTWSRDWASELRSVEARVNEIGLPALSSTTHLAAATMASAASAQVAAQAAPSVNVQAYADLFVAVDPTTGEVRQVQDPRQIEKLVRQGMREGRYPLPVRNVTGRAA